VTSAEPDEGVLHEEGEGRQPGPGPQQDEGAGEVEDAQSRAGDTARDALVVVALLLLRVARPRQPELLQALHLTWGGRSCMISVP